MFNMFLNNWKFGILSYLKNIQPKYLQLLEG